MTDRKQRCLLFVLLLLGAFPVLASAQLTGIYTFNGNVEGRSPNQPSLLAQGRDGNLYSTLSEGGPQNAGSSFKYAMSGVPSLANFGNSTGMTGSNSGYTLGIDGNLYGGVDYASGGQYGAVLKSTGGLPSPIYWFPGGTDGYFPKAPPIQGPDLNLYGVTKDYGNAGVAYQILTSNNSKGWTVKLPSGSTAPLILGNDGNFYGTYSNGSFLTSGGVVGTNGGGWGGIFQITPAGVIGWYKNLNGASEGGNPIGPVMLAADGNLYGTSSGGSYCSSCGVVFRIAANGTGYSVIHSFQSPDGTGPHSGLIQGSDGYLYGLTSVNGTLSPKLKSLGYIAAGTLYKLSTTGANFTVLVTFWRTSGTNGWGTGSDPESTFTLHTNGRIYGFTNTGGNNSTGAVTGPGGFDDGGEFFTYNAGLSPFISNVGGRYGRPGNYVGIIGQGFLNATGVTFGGVAVQWGNHSVVVVLTDTYMLVKIPFGHTGPITVYETSPSGVQTTLSTNYNFKVCTLFSSCP